MHRPESVLENERSKIHLNFEIQAYYSIFLPFQQNKMGEEKKKDKQIFEPC